MMRTAGNVSRACGRARRRSAGAALLALIVSWSGLAAGSRAAAEGPGAASAPAATASPPSGLVPFGPDPAAHLGPPIGRTGQVKVGFDLVLRASPGDRFTPTRAAVGAVTTWLARYGVHPRLVGTALEAVATSGVVSRLLDVSFENYRLGTSTVYASTRARIPRPIARDLRAIVGLSDRPAASPGVVRQAAHRLGTAQSGTAQSGTAHSGTAQSGTAARAVRATALTPTPALTPGVAPAVVPSACPAASAAAGSGSTLVQAGDDYGIGSLLSAGLEGAGTTVAVVEFAPSSTTDIDAYDSCFGIDPANHSVVEVSDGVTTGGSNVPNGTLEADLDIEQIQTQAPEAKVISYEAPNTPAGEVDVLAAITAADTAEVISVSWGSCEAAQGSTGALDQLYATAAAQHQTVLVASGDDGSEGCYAPPSSNPSTLAVQYPASDPNVTAVGGSVPGSPDTVWNDCASATSLTCSQGGGGASGGGLSSDYPEPSWQSALVPGLGGRGVPDLAADAETNQLVYYGGGWVGGIGGTSASAPLVAGLVADAVTTCSSPIGNLAPHLYALEQQEGYGTGLSDVTSGNNDWTDATGHADYPAGAGYDLATGLGTPLATGLTCPVVTSLSSDSSAPGTSITISGTALSGSTVSFGSVAATVTADSATSLTVTVPGGGGSSELVVTNPIGPSLPQGFTFAGATATTATSTPAATTTTTAPSTGPTPPATTTTTAGVLSPVDVARGPGVPDARGGGRTRGGHRHRQARAPRALLPRGALRGIGHPRPDRHAPLRSGRRLGPAEGDEVDRDRPLPGRRRRGDRGGGAPEPGRAGRAPRRKEPPAHRDRAPPRHGGAVGHPHGRRRDRPRGPLRLGRPGGEERGAGGHGAAHLREVGLLGPPRAPPRPADHREPQLPDRRGGGRAGHRAPRRGHPGGTGLGGGRAPRRHRAGQRALRRGPLEADQGLSDARSPRSPLSGGAGRAGRRRPGVRCPRRAGP